MSRDGTHVTVPRVGASRVRNLVVPCVLTPQLPPCAIPHLISTHSPSSLYSLLILSPFACHHSPAALSIPLSSPHWPSPILATFLSMACVLKRFPLTSPRKLSLTCVKRGFLRTAEPHGTSQLSPCAPQVSQCHVHAVPGRDVPCSFTTALSVPPVCKILSCPVPNPTAPNPAQSHISLPAHFPSSPYSLVILSLLTFLHSPDALAIPL